MFAAFSHAARFAVELNPVRGQSRLGVARSKRPKTFDRLEGGQVELGQFDLGIEAQLGLQVDSGQAGVGLMDEGVCELGYTASLDSESGGHGVPTE